jgi:hypothetical protein
MMDLNLLLYSMCLQYVSTVCVYSVYLHQALYLLVPDEIALIMVFEESIRIEYRRWLSTSTSGQTI